MATRIFHNGPPKHLRKMKQPPNGWTTEVEIKRVYDGDTLIVDVHRTLTVRLKDCWCSEIRTRDKEEKKKGIAARNHLREILLEEKNEDTGKLEYIKAVLHIPASEDSELKDVFTFGRVLGHIFIDGKDVSEIMIESGHATKEKDRKN
tara:strand:- start:196 stop:639 length:444 start_codon:yes stop_codon:yes gene_type:complete